MPRKFITAFAALAVAFAVAAPAALADLPEYPVTIAESAGKITFTYHDPASTGYPSAALLIDSNDDGKADKSILAYWNNNNTMSAHFDIERYSTDTCQEVWQGVENTEVAILQPSGDVQLSVDAATLGPDFTAKAVLYDFGTNSCSTMEYSGVPTTMHGAVRFAAPAPAPANPHAVAGNGRVTVTWDPVAGADSYAVYVDGARYPNVAGGHTFTLPNGALYRFEVAAVRAGVEGVRSQSVTATPSDPPPPTNFAGVAAEWGVMFTWDPVAGVDHYEIYADGTPYQWVDAGSTRSFVWAVADRTYRFDVRAVRGDLESAPSESVYATPHASPAVDPPVEPQPPVAPQPPVGPRPPVHPADPDGDGIRNDWLVAGKAAPAPAKPTVRTLTGTSLKVRLPKVGKGTTLAVYVRAGGGAFAKVTGKPTAHGELTIKRLKRNTTYELKLVKVKAGKQSAASKPLKVKTKKK